MKFITWWLAAFLSMTVPFHDASANSLLVLGKHAALTRTVIVCPAASEAESGANLMAALDSIAATAEQPYLLKIEPGIYDLGQSSLQMKPHVDIEGSGQAITVIKGSIEGLNGVVRGSSNAEIRELKIVNTFDGEDYGVGFACDNASPVIRNVTIEVLQGCKFPRGISSSQSNPEMIGLAVYVFGSQIAYGVRHKFGTPTMKDLYVDASSSEEGEDVVGIYVSDAGTQDAPAILQNIRAIAHGGHDTEGLSIYGSILDAKNLDCLAKNADWNTGLSLDNSPGSVSVSHSFSAARGGEYATGIYVAREGSNVLANVTAAASGATEGNIGLIFTYTAGPETLRIDHCRISGSSNSIENGESHNTLYVGTSKLDGPVSTTGTWHCSRCYDGSNTPLDGSCQ